MPSLRVRFAPSPAGLLPRLPLHQARTALFNWFLARGGERGSAFVLRVDDLDGVGEAGSAERYELELMEDLLWLGLRWDEGPVTGGPYAPYRQSERLALYARHAEQLLSGGQAYRCFCGGEAAEEVDRDSHATLANHEPKSHAHCVGPCRAIAPEESAARAAKGERFAVRLRTPEHPLRFADRVHGEMEFPHEAVADTLLLRAGTVREPGLPTSLYAGVVDDALMGITHVVREDEHLADTPREVAIYEAFGWRVPEFAHLPAIVHAHGKDPQKSAHAGVGSGEISTVAGLRALGILPEALVNYMALLGWGPRGGEQEIFSSEELVRAFELGHVAVSPAQLDWAKLHFFNRHYLRTGDVARLLGLAWPFWTAAGMLPARGAAPGEVVGWAQRVLELFLHSIDQLDELPAKAAFLFGVDAAAARAEPENAAVLSGPGAAAALRAFAARVDGPEGEVTPELFHEWMKEVSTETGVEGKELFLPVRIALTGTHAGPEFERLLPVIAFGAELPLPKRVLGVRERMLRFVGEV